MYYDKNAEVVLNADDYIIEAAFSQFYQGATIRDIFRYLEYRGYKIKISSIRRYFRQMRELGKVYFDRNERLWKG